jgi:lipopolysaccharide export system protein LptA
MYCFNFYQIFETAFKKVFNKTPGPLSTFLVFTIIYTSCIAYAEKPLNDNDETEKIHIKADSLTVNSNDTYFEFTGNAKATQGDTVITSHSLKIFYDGSEKKGDNVTPDKKSIKEIIATKNVEIRFDNRVAVTNKAVYNTESRILVLTGKGSRVMTEGNYISGEKITVNRNTGHIIFERGSIEPVTAVINAAKKGLK